MDLADVAGNVSDGVHIAAAGGVWKALVFGFGGVREYDGRAVARSAAARGVELARLLAALPRPSAADPLSHEGDRYSVEEGELDVTIGGVEHRLVPGRDFVSAPQLQP